MAADPPIIAENPAGQELRETQQEQARGVRRVDPLAKEVLEADGRVELPPVEEGHGVGDVESIAGFDAKGPTECDSERFAFADGSAPPSSPSLAPFPSWGRS